MYIICIKMEIAGMRIRGLEESGTSFSGEKDIPVDSQQIIDKNLDEMMGSIGRLKGKKEKFLVLHIFCIDKR